MSGMLLSIGGCVCLRLYLRWDLTVSLQLSRGLRWAIWGTLRLYVDLGVVVTMT